MISKKNNIVILYIKNKGMNCTSVSKQTKNIRENTNNKIRELGNKYYSIKALFEKYSLKRDYIFAMGKQLVEEFKDIKIGIHLQNQARRMKEALYCWYAEFFYDELIEPNSVLLRRIINNITVLTFMTPNSKSLSFIKKKQMKSKSSSKQNIEITPRKDVQSQFKINQEVDSFMFSNISKDNSKGNDNFSFEKLFDF